MAGSASRSQPLRPTELAVDTESIRSIVVMELGAGWPSWQGTSISDLGGGSVQAQASGEAPSVFAARVVQRIGTLSGVEKVQRVVLAWTPEVTAPALSSRFRIARAAIHAMQGVPQAELVICATVGATGGARHELLGLVAALCDDFSSAKVSVSVDFSVPPAQSRAVARGSTEPWDWGDEAVS